MTGQGSFRGIPFFIVEDSERTGGNRLIKHEYPLRDTGKIQNMGRKLNAVTINVIVLGDNYLGQRDKLEAALKSSEAGELVHPDFPTQLVYIEEWRARISTQARRVVHFTITYLPAQEHGESPTTALNQQVVLSEKVATLSDALAANLKAFFDQNPINASRVAETLSFAECLANNLTSAIRSVTNETGLSDLLSSALALNGAIDKLFEAPDTVVSEITALIKGISQIGGKKAIYATSAILMSNGLLSSPNAHTGALQMTITSAVLSGQAAIIAADAAAAVQKRKQSGNELQQETGITTLKDCEQASKTLNTKLQEQRIEISDAFWYDAAAAIRAVQQVFTQQMTALSSQLALSAAITVMETEPALVALYRHQGDCQQVARFVARNGVRHPTFITGGKTYEVIDDA